MVDQVKLSGTGPPPSPPIARLRIMNAFPPGAPGTPNGQLGRSPGLTVRVDLAVLRELDLPGMAVPPQVPGVPAGAHAARNRHLDGRVVPVVVGGVDGRVRRPAWLAVD